MVSTIDMQREPTTNWEKKMELPFRLYRVNFMDYAQEQFISEVDAIEFARGYGWEVRVECHEDGNVYLKGFYSYFGGYRKYSDAERNIVTVIA
jgi:hypothetical protein